jgi:nucleoside-diphosphate-sugar epimerase
MRTLVIGGTRFVGAAIVEELARRGARTSELRAWRYGSRPRDFRRGGVVLYGVGQREDVALVKVVRLPAGEAAQVDRALGRARHWPRSRELHR